MTRKLVVYVDDARSGEVRWNRSIDIAQKPGHHFVHVRMDWCQSSPLEITLSEGEVIELAVAMPTGAIKRLLVMCLQPFRFFELLSYANN